MSEELIYVIDDDPDLRDSLQWLLESVGLQTQGFETAIEFLDKYQKDMSGCIVMDVRMPGLSGINAQVKFAEAEIDLPIIMISGHANIDMAVRAMSQGAITFLEKPFDDQVLIDHVQNAIELNRAHRKDMSSIADQKEKYNSLTKREKQIFECIVQGLSNQETADELSITRKTVEGHRANMLAKMEVSSLADLVQIAIAIGVISLKH